MDNTFLREAIEKIEELTDSAREPHVVEIAGKTYCDKSMSRYDREEFAEPLTATSLNSLIDYISVKRIYDHSRRISNKSKITIWSYTGKKSRRIIPRRYKSKWF